MEIARGLQGIVVTMNLTSLHEKQSLVGRAWGFNYWWHQIPFHCKHTKFNFQPFKIQKIILLLSGLLLLNFFSHPLFVWILCRDPVRLYIVIFYFQKNIRGFFFPFCVLFFHSMRFLGCCNMIPLQPSINFNYY